MAIIKFTKGFGDSPNSYVQRYPNQYVSDKTKRSDDWVKTTMDYFYNIAINKYTHNKRTFVRNYEILNGKLRREDFYEEPAVRSFTEQMIAQEDLPKYVQSFSIIKPAMNTLIGEMTKRPDNMFVKAYDDDSKSEEFQYKTQLMQDFILQQVRERIYMQLAQQGVEMDESGLEQADAMTQEQVEEYMTSFTSTAEKWGSKMLEYIKVKFSMKEKSEEGFRDLLITGREFYHIYEDKSSEGFNIQVLNPKNVWYASSKDEKYISDPFDLSRGAFAAGTIEVMEMSEILARYPLTIKEVEHLTEYNKKYQGMSGHDSFDGKTGIESIRYDTYDPVIEQERLFLEAEIEGDGHTDDLTSLLLPGSEISSFGNKFIVVNAYWCSKKKIGKLTFINEENITETILVDDNYKDNMHPQQIDLEWGWINQWYQGLKIGEVYYVKPFELLDYCPIIGSIFENKNAEAQSFVDMLKPFQTTCNIFMNKLYESVQKDKGKVFIMNGRHIPIPKGGTAQEARELWEAEIAETGTAYIDDSPQNAEVPSHFNQYAVHDASRIDEMLGYYNMFAQVKTEAWELAGITRQRMGSVQATETATATNTALAQSYAQTEPWFMHHDYTMNKLYQAALDAAQYIESNKPESILSFVDSEGNEQFLRTKGSDIAWKDIGVFVTSRAEDAQELRELKQHAQAMLQNGASPYEVVEIYTTKSRRQIRDKFKKLKEQQDQLVERQQAVEEQKIQQAQQQFEQQQQLLIAQQDKVMQNDNYNKERDRQNKIEVELLKQSSEGDSATSGTSINPLDIEKLTDSRNKTVQDNATKMREISLKEQQILQNASSEAAKRDLEREKIQVAREKMANDLKIARENKAQ